MDKNLTQNNINEDVVISVIIATKNGGRFLSRSVASIEKQSEKNIEVIIVSDGSTDDTLSIVQNLAATRPFIKIVNLEKNIGPGLARNAGIEKSAGKYIALLDDDDEWLDADKLKNQKNFLDKNPDHVLVGADETEFVNESGQQLFVYKPKTNDAEIRSKILSSNQFVTSSVMFRKEAFQKAGGFADMRLAEDYDLWLRLLLTGKATNIRGSKTRYYKRQNGSQQANQAKMNRIVLGLIKRYKNQFPHSFLAIIKAYARILRKTSSGTSFGLLG